MDKIIECWVLGFNNGKLECIEENLTEHHLKFDDIIEIEGRNDLDIPSYFVFERLPWYGLLRIKE